MKLVDHGRAAASAEVQRLQRLALRYAVRVAFLVMAALFALFTLIAAHVLLWVICFGPWHTGRVWASVIVFGVDILFTVVFLVLGRGKAPGAVELDARIRRDRDLVAMRNAFAMSAVAATVVGPAGRMAGRGVWGMLRSRRRRRKDGYYSR